MILLGKTDCSTSIKGTGTKGCKVNLNYLTQFNLLEEGVEFDVVNDTIDQTKVDSLIQDNKLVSLPAHDSFENQSGEFVYEELPTGIKLPIRNGLYEFLPMFTKGGICFSKALASLGSKNWTLLFIDLDEEGNSRVWGEKTSNGKFRGFDLSLVNVENIQFNDGSVSTKTPLRLQLSQKGTAAMRSRVDFLSAANSIDFASIDGVNDVILEAETTTASNFKVNAFIGCGGSVPVSSNTLSTNWKVTNASTGIDVVPTSIVFSSGSYLISGIPAGTYDVKFYDSVADSEIIVSSGNYYNSDVLNVTLT